MTIEKLIQQIQEESAKRIARIKSEAEKEAEEILRQAKEKLTEQRKKEISRIDQKMKEYEESLISPARLEANQMILRMKQKLLDELLNKILAMWEKQPRQFKQQLYRQWLKNFSGGELLISSKEKDIWTDDFLKEINSGKKSFKIGGISNEFQFGFRLKEEKSEIDFSSSVLLENFRREVAVWINQEYFNG